MSLFGGANTGAQSSLFGGMGSSNNQAPAGGSSLFGGAPAQPSTSLFGGSNTNTQPQSTSLFGPLGGAQQQQQQQPQQSSLFGPSMQNSNMQPVQADQSSLFTRSGGLFGSAAPAPQSTSLFGTDAGSQLRSQGAGYQGNSVTQQLQSSRIWNERDAAARQKTIGEQMQTVFDKWNHGGRSSVFRAYLYNYVNPDVAPFYRPTPEDDPEKWEEALAKAPAPGAIPILVKGFQELGARVVMQAQHFATLQGRLHEINNGLSELLRRHDLEISTRAAECRRRHVRLSQRCLALATKTQILRNRGYALDAAEEELAQKLRKLEKDVMDPALSGREEEIWARMVGLRERGRMLQAEFEREGRPAQDEGDGAIDDETLKRAKKVLDDYDSQLAHLSKELGSITEDFEGLMKDRQDGN